MVHSACLCDMSCVAQLTWNKNFSETYLVIYQATPYDKENEVYSGKLRNKYHTPNNFGIFYLFLQTVSNS